jgi:phenylalanyl-tRNA synthetase alpha chain
MSDQLELLQQQASAEIAAAADTRALEQVRVDLLGKKGRVTEQLKHLGTLQGYERKAFGERVNKVKEAIIAAIEARDATLANAQLQQRLAAETIDVTLPGRGDQVGGLHRAPSSASRSCSANWASRRSKGRRSRTISTISGR